MAITRGCLSVLEVLLAVDTSLGSQRCRGCGRVEPKLAFAGELGDGFGDPLAEDSLLPDLSPSRMS